MRKLLLPLLLTATCFAADLTGNWVVEKPMNDGTVRKSYIDFQQDGTNVTGTVRVTQFYYTVSRSSVSNLGIQKEKCSAVVLGHGVVLLRVKGQ
jgi:hypothetical protein